MLASSASSPISPSEQTHPQLHVSVISASRSRGVDVPESRAQLSGGLGARSSPSSSLCATRRSWGRRSSVSSSLLRSSCPPPGCAGAGSGSGGALGRARRRGGAALRCARSEGAAAADDRHVPLCLGRAGAGAGINPYRYAPTARALEPPRRHDLAGRQPKGLEDGLSAGRTGVVSRGTRRVRERACGPQRGSSCCRGRRDRLWSSCSRGRRTARARRGARLASARGQRDRGERTRRRARARSLARRCSRPGHGPRGLAGLAVGSVRWSSSGRCCSFLLSRRGGGRRFLGGGSDSFRAGSVSTRRWERDRRWLPRYADGGSGLARLVDSCRASAGTARWRSWSSCSSLSSSSWRCVHTKPSSRYRALASSCSAGPCYDRVPAALVRPLAPTVPRRDRGAGLALADGNAAASVRVRPRRAPPVVGARRDLRAVLRSARASSRAAPAVGAALASLSEHPRRGC